MMDMDRYFPGRKIVYTGNPVRENLLKQADNLQEAIDYFGLKENSKVVLIVGGSLGARSVNEAVMKNIEFIAGSGVEFIWQTGSIYYKDILAKLEGKFPPTCMFMNSFRVWTWLMLPPQLLFPEQAQAQYPNLPCCQTCNFGSFAKCS
jgi:UDP-N-acetylglucosamine:LPS N-acetylglucosamine transferase